MNVIISSPHFKNLSKILHKFMTHIGPYVFIKPSYNIICVKKYN